MKWPSFCRVGPRHADGQLRPPGTPTSALEVTAVISPISGGAGTQAEGGELFSPESTELVDSDSRAHTPLPPFLQELCHPVIRFPYLASFLFKAFGCSDLFSVKGP